MAYKITDEQGHPIIHKGNNVIGFDNLEDVELKDFNDKEQSFLAVASSEIPDRFQDVLLVKGWQLKNYRKNPCVLFAHNYSSVPVGRSLEEFSQQKKGVERLMFRPQFHTLTEEARTLYSLFRDGYIKSFSVGFLPKKSEPIKDDKKKDEDEHQLFHQPTLYKLMELLEISACPVPANPDCLAEIKTMVKNGSLYIPARYLQEKQTPEVETYDDYIHVKVEDEAKFTTLHEDGVADGIVRVFGTFGYGEEFTDYKFIFSRELFNEEKAKELAGKMTKDGYSGEGKIYDPEAYAVKEAVLIDAFPVLDENAFAEKKGRRELDTAKSLKEQFDEALNKEKQLEDFEYLLHHVVTDENGKEVIHHCYILDHMANLFEQQHIVVKDGKATIGRKKITDGVFHIIKGLEPTQEITWSDEEARNNKIKPKKMAKGMTYKEKAKEW